MAGRPLGADDSALAREPGETSLLSTLLKPGLSGQPMRPGHGAKPKGGTMPNLQDLVQLLMLIHMLRKAGSPF